MTQFHSQVFACKSYKIVACKKKWGEPSQKHHMWWMWVYRSGGVACNFLASFPGLSGEGPGGKGLGTTVCCMRKNYPKKW